MENILKFDNSVDSCWKNFLLEFFLMLFKVVLTNPLVDIISRMFNNSPVEIVNFML